MNLNNKGNIIKLNSLLIWCISPWISSLPIWPCSIFLYFRLFFADPPVFSTPLLNLYYPGHLIVAFLIFFYLGPSIPKHPPTCQVALWDAQSILGVSYVWWVELFSFLPHDHKYLYLWFCISTTILMSPTPSLKRFQFLLVLRSWSIPLLHIMLQARRMFWQFVSAAIAASTFSALSNFSRELIFCHSHSCREFLIAQRIFRRYPLS